MTNTAEESFSNEAIREDLALLTPEQMREELVRWRSNIPNVVKMTKELTGFRQFAANPESLADKINTMVRGHKAELELHQQAIERYTQILKRYEEDPYGVASKVSTLMRAVKKLH